VKTTRRAFIAAIAAALGFRAKAPAAPLIPIRHQVRWEFSDNPAWMLYDACIRSCFRPEELDIGGFQAAANLFDQGKIGAAFGLMKPNKLFTSKESRELGWALADGRPHVRGWNQNI
jgi:hypothetical protein